MKNITLYICFFFFYIFKKCGVKILNWYTMDTMKDFLKIYCTCK